MNAALLLLSLYFGPVLVLLIAFELIFHFLWPRKAHTALAFAVKSLVRGAVLAPTLGGGETFSYIVPLPVGLALDPGSATTPWALGAAAAIAVIAYAISWLSYRLRVDEEIRHLGHPR